ncbi:hypothetical protein [Streptomyces thioluteus]|uniref:hypothetical protein n=1 Tax=Streptomyces thioluteus TaxID=66431 RepID=UPI0031E81D12
MADGFVELVADLPSLGPVDDGEGVEAASTGSTIWYAPCSSFGEDRSRPLVPGDRRHRRRAQGVHVERAAEPAA